MVEYGNARVGPWAGNCGHVLLGGLFCVDVSDQHQTGGVAEEIAGAKQADRGAVENGARFDQGSASAGWRNSREHEGGCGGGDSGRGRESLKALHMGKG